ncbi:hypothetical protein [Mammaliicoccus lentus]|nr:hypothetical protein [Mammaliicoccus lentus]MBW0768153.1 hypothetical protein [Mammaliicoccus lentus]
MKKITIRNYEIEPAWLIGLVACLLITGFQIFIFPVLVLAIVYGVHKID